LFAKKRFYSFSQANFGIFAWRVLFSYCLFDKSTKHSCYSINSSPLASWTGFTSYQSMLTSVVVFLCTVSAHLALGNHRALAI